jgi:hypothetical protein
MCGHKEREWQETAENCIRRGFMICFAHRMLSPFSQLRCDVARMGEMSSTYELLVGKPEVKSRDDL